ncbi:hypothetical protein NE281_08905, partial [Leuconostoc mesenteroides]|uniref:hypothetical protein n=1 Tax=Leuconostoc mesenteroides TaxID=1245 RepID=UPI0020730098
VIFTIYHKLIDNRITKQSQKNKFLEKKKWIVIFFALINSGFVGFEIQKSANYLKVYCTNNCKAVIFFCED